MAKTAQDYLNLITSEYQQQPNFTAMISFFAAVPVQVQNLLESMITTIFNLDTPPVGNQLDIIGQWVGISRNVSVPISGVFFSWDGAASVGWNYGSWQPVPAVVAITSLPDDVYLTLIRAKIAANNWDGTTEGAYKIWAIVFPQFEILIQDYNNMTYALGIVGGIVDSLTIALIEGGYIPLRPEGVQIKNYFVAIDTNPGFSWDTENAYLQGWNQGSWLKSV